MNNKTKDICINILKEREGRLLALIRSSSVKAAQGNKQDATLKNRYESELKDIRHAIKEIKCLG